MFQTLLLALFSIQSAFIGETPSKDQLKFESKTAGYSIMLPREWRATADKRVFSQDGRPIIVDLWANEPQKHISLEIFVTHVVVEENPASAEAVLKDISQYIGTYKVEESNQVTLDGLPAAYHVITYNDVIEFAKVKYVVTSNRQIYAITFTMPKIVLEQNKQYIEHIIKTIHFEKHEK